MRIPQQQIKFTNWILYNGTEKPTESISDGRWRAIVKKCLRELSQQSQPHNSGEKQR